MWHGRNTQNKTAAKVNQNICSRPRQLSKNCVLIQQLKSQKMIVAVVFIYFFVGVSSHHLPILTKGNKQKK